ncbi:MAG TPA: transcriptional regulator, partial [Candidatus Nitrosotalea sp.]|nr:transcriptional regulator [Candidatus Nitrosotalea sp.]
MGTIYENAANDFLELASEQRLKIIFKLLEQKSKISNMAKELHATVQEVHRNFERLSNAGLILKDKDGLYDLTTYGKTMCTQVPSLLFLSRNRKYFETHDFGDIPMKFIQRIGALAGGQQIKGFVNVLEQWKLVYKNAD